HALTVSAWPTIAATSALSRRRIGVGVAFGAISPSQIVASYVGTPASLIVGTSGSTAERTSPVVPSALTLPERTNSLIVVTASNIMSTCPPSTSVRAPELPLYGMCRIATPAIALNSSPAMWYGVPGPDDAYVIAPGFAFAAAISSATVETGKPLLATRTRSDELIGAIGTKSRIS